MSEIITVHVGGSGTKVGLKFWEELTSLMHEQKKEIKNEYYHKLYHQQNKQESVPRAVFIDTDIRTKNLVSQSKLNFNNKLVFGEGNSTRNLFSEGRYTIGANLKESFQNQIRKQFQKCDRVSGFIITQSPAGGAGSGLGSNVMSIIRENYCDRIVQNFKIVPGFQPDFRLRNLDPLQSYNIILSTHYAIQNTDIIYCFQNKAVQRILSNQGVIHPDFGQINSQMGHCLNEHIFPYISAGQLNLNQRKRAVNLVVFPRMKTICGSISQKNAKNMVQSSLSYKNKMMDFQSHQDKKIYSININVRDSSISEMEINKSLNNWIQASSNTCVQWLPNSVHLFIGNQNAVRRKSSWSLVNGQNNINWIKKTGQLFTGLMRRRAFLHHYLSDGMDEMQFMEAQSNCNGLVSQYISYGQDQFMEEDQLYQEMN